MKRWPLVAVLSSCLLSSCDGCALDTPDARTPANLEDVHALVDVDSRDAQNQDVFRREDASPRDVLENVDGSQTQDVDFDQDAGLADAERRDVMSRDVQGHDTASSDVTTDVFVLPDARVLDVASTDVSATDVVSSDAGTSAPASCNNAGLCITLEWNAAYGDLDLHVSLNEGAWCTDDACYFGNCTTGGPFRIDWDGVDGFSPGDPDLIDDGFARGPEVFTIESPFIANYTVGAYFQPNNNPPVDATLRIFSFGRLVATETHELAPNTFWQAGRVQIAANALSFNANKRICASGEWICTDAVDACSIP